ARRRRQPAKAALLPSRDDLPRRAAVDHARPRPCERDPPSFALPAARDRPRRRRAAALAQGPCQPLETLDAVVAELGASRPARDAPLRKQEVEDRCHPRKRSGHPDEECVESETTMCRNSGGIDDVLVPFWQAVAPAQAVVGFQQLAEIADVEPGLVEPGRVHRLTLVEPPDEEPGVIRGVARVEGGGGQRAGGFWESGRRGL